MKTYISDMIWVKRLERDLGRELSREELDSLDPIEVRFKDGHYQWIEIPKLEFPRDVLSDLSQMQMSKCDDGVWRQGQPQEEENNYYSLLNQNEPDLDDYETAQRLYEAP